MYQRGVVLMISLVLGIWYCSGQNLSGQLEKALQKLATDVQFKHALISMYVTDSKTGSVIIDRLGHVGMSPASCQKVITSVSAFELLGKGFKYKTYIDAGGQVNKGVLPGNLSLMGGGDPTLGSDRWNSTSEPIVLKQILSILQKNKIQSVTGDLVCDDIHFTTEPVPEGWVWEDIGNYYGAGAWGINWKENKFDITFKTGKREKDTTKIVSTKPASILKEYVLANFVTTGASGSGDNAFLYSSPFHKNIIARGTVPLSVNGFTISGAMPHPPGTFMRMAREYIEENGIKITGNTVSLLEQRINNQPASVLPMVHLDSILSPSLDSINYWFLKKSINLFGESFVKMIAFQKAGSGSTETGISVLKEFWSKLGIEKSALNMIDGSGLSPANRITTHSLVTVLNYAKRRPWFGSFYHSLPEMNGIKMKDGYIGGVRSYSGYIKSKNGSEYTFAFIVNNFDGNPGTAREKIWKMLDLLK